MASTHAEGRLRAPHTELTAEKRRAFRGIFRDSLGHGGLVEYASPFPKWEFLQYLVEHEDVLLHGSNDAEIALFRPLRQSLDARQQGSRPAVYATSDPIWPVFFAIVDRSRYRGSLRNDVSWTVNALGHRSKHYYFSLDERSLAGNPWTSGTIYILPRAGFRRLGSESEEWSSSKPVRPLARLRVAAEDFPFLHNVDSHDDSESLRFQDLKDVLFDSRDDAIELPDGFELRFRRSETIERNLTEFAALFRRILPWTTVEFGAGPGEDRLWLRLRGPEALKSVVADRLAASQTRA